MAEAEATVATTSLRQRQDRSGSGKVRITEVRFVDALSGRSRGSLRCGRDMVIEMDYEPSNGLVADLQDVDMGLSFYGNTGQFLLALNNRMASGVFESIAPRGTLRCRVPRLPLMGGLYHVSCRLLLRGNVADHIEHAVTVFVENGDYYGSGYDNAHGRQGVYVDQQWSAQAPDGRELTVSSGQGDGDEVKLGQAV